MNVDISPNFPPMSSWTAAAPAGSGSDGGGISTPSRSMRLIMWVLLESGPRTQWPRRSTAGANRSFAVVVGDRTSRAAGRPVEHCRDVLEQLQRVAERAALDQLEGDVGIPVEDPAPPGGAGDDGEQDHAEAVHEASFEQRPGQAQAAEGAQGRVV